MKGQKIVVLSAFFVQLYYIILNGFSFPEPVLWATYAILLILFYWGSFKYVRILNIDKSGYFITVLFILWLLTEYIIGLQYLHGYWMWKSFLFNLLKSFFFIIIFLGSEAFFLQGIYRLHFKYVLFLILGTFIIFGTSINTNYLPYSTLLLFVGLIPRRKLWYLLGIVTLLFFVQYQRNDMIKIVVVATIGISISYYYKFISGWFIKSLFILLFIVPFILLFLGITGKFNVFDLNSYVKGKHYIEVKTSEGKIINEDLKIDTRTFIYKNVFYTMHEYNAWYFGRSPAFGDEGKIGITAIKSDITHEKGRYANEVQIMNILLWYGVVGVFLYFALYIRAAYLAIYKSRNRFMKGIGLYIAFLWVMSFVWEVTNIETYFMMNIVFIGVSFSKTFRNMTDADFKYWVYGIFYIQPKVLSKKI